MIEAGVPSRRCRSCPRRSTTSAGKTRSFRLRPGFRAPANPAETIQRGRWPSSSSRSRAWRPPARCRRPRRRATLPWYSPSMTECRAPRICGPWTAGRAGSRPRPTSRRRCRRPPGPAGGPGPRAAGRGRSAGSRTVAAHVRQISFR